MNTQSVSRFHLFANNSPCNAKRRRTPPRMALASILILALSLALGGCTLRLGTPGKLKDLPASTTIPLQATAEPVDAPGLVPPKKAIALPPGFTIHVFAQGLDGPRMLAVGPDGGVYVAERGAKQVVRLIDLDGDGQAEQRRVVASGLQFPNSLAFYRDGSLYVGEVTRVIRLSQPDDQGVFQQMDVILDDLPDGGHNTRTVLFSPDWEYLFVSIGSSCNVCEEADERRAAIMRYKPDGSGGEVFGRGLRNAVGITFRPGTTELWASNNGRDMLGDDLPPETVQRVDLGADFGWPRCHAGRIPDPDFGGVNACEGVSRPEVEMQAHSAPLGLNFYQGVQFPPEYQGGLFVAFHGSWNRSQPTGYKVVFIPFSNGQPRPVQDFATGWLADGSSWGRPVDVVVFNGSLLVSDDGGGMIYRIDYHGGK